LASGILDFARQVITIAAGRMPRFGGIEAAPKTDPRDRLSGQLMALHATLTSRLTHFTSLASQPRIALDVGILPLSSPLACPSPRPE
jgi:hypothetical protein